MVQAEDLVPAALPTCGIGFTEDSKRKQRVLTPIKW